MTKVLLAALIIAAIWYLLKPKPKVVTGDAEARAILGVGLAATSDEIREAHRRLVSATHPDRGGSAELTRRINAARDVLLRQS
jgi:DnaJ family protein C protein 19